MEMGIELRIICALVEIGAALIISMVLGRIAAKEQRKLNSKFKDNNT
jgi:hypothetical protein